MFDARTFIGDGVASGIPYEVRVKGYLEYVARRLYFGAKASLHDALAIEAGDEAALMKYGITIPPKSEFSESKEKGSPPPDNIFQGSAEVVGGPEEGGENEGGK